MSNSSLTVRVPGKLMIAGEYAVLVKHQKLIVMAVDRFVYATLEDNADNRLSLYTYNLMNIPWDYQEKEVCLADNDRHLQFVKDAMTVAYAYLMENNIIPGPFHLKVRSELDDDSGRKFGLGSSAAVVTSVVSAILKKYLAAQATPNLIFKLAAIAHVKSQGSGSGADVAASSYGGWLEYSSFQSDWLQKEYQERYTVTELVTKKWPYYTSRSLTLPDSVYMCIGWTGSPASTSKLVKKIAALKSENEKQYQQFLTKSKQAVSLFLDGFDKQEASLIMKGTKQNRQALQQLGNDAGTEIETPMLTRLCDLAEAFGGAGKPSGAGGGDCGIAFMPTKEKAQQLMKAWEQAGIRPLEIMPCLTGASEI